MKSKREIALFLLSEITKTEKKILEKRAKEYLKPFKDKPWYNLAVKYLVSFTLDMQEFLTSQKKQYIKWIKGKKKIYTVQKAKYRTEQYLDARHDKVIVDDVRDELVELGKGFEKDLQGRIENMLHKGLIKGSTESVMGSTGMEFNFNQFNKFTRDYLKDKKIHWAKQVQETTERTIKEILVDGYEKGEGINDIARKIKEVTDFSIKRAETIARTEIMAACNYSDLVAWSHNPNIVGKEWDSAGDSRVRPTHRAANGQIRKINEPFNVGASKLMHPVDGSLGADAREVCNCRCTMYQVYKDEWEDNKNNKTVYDEKDLGTEDWLNRRDEDFQKDYLGGKRKKALFKNGLLGKDEFNKPWQEVKADRIDKAIKNSKSLPVPNRIKFEEHIKDVLGSGLEKMVEYAIAMDLVSGNRVHKKVSSGIEGNVYIPEEMVNKIDKKPEKSIILIHNHPREGSLSIGDLITLSKHKSVKNIIAIDHFSKIYSLEIVDLKKYNKNKNNIPQDFGSLLKKQGIILSKNMTNNDVLKVFKQYHIFWIEHAKSYGLEYKYGGVIN